MGKITQWLRSISISIYDLHIHWAFTIAWQTLCVSFLTLSPSLKLAISNILPTPHTFYLISDLSFSSQDFSSYSEPLIPPPRLGWPHLSPGPQISNHFGRLAFTPSSLSPAFVASLFAYSFFPPARTLLNLLHVKINVLDLSCCCC